MKKIIIIIVAVSVLVVGGFFLINQGGIGSGKHKIAEIVPSDPLLYVQLNDTKENLDKLTLTPYWKALSQIDFDALIASPASNMNEKIVLSVLQKLFDDPQNNEIFTKFFGKDVAVVLYAADFDEALFAEQSPEATMKMLQDLLSSVYVVTRLDAQAQLAEFISRSFEEFGDDVSVEEEGYKGHTIKLISFSGADISVAYVRIKDLMVMGVGSDAIKRSIDIAKGGAESLDKDEKFVDASRRFVKNPGFITYFNMEGFFETVEAQLSKIAKSTGISEEQIRLQLEQSFDSMKGFKSINSSGTWEDLMEVKVDFLFNRDQMSPAIASFYSDCKNIDNETINFIPQETLGYQWGNCFDLTYYWDEMKKEMERTAAVKSGQPSVTQQISQMEQALGMTIEGDIIPAFGKQLGGYIKEIHTDKGFPVPEILLYIEIQDQAKAEKLIGLLKSQPMAMFQNESYGDVELNYMPIPVAAYLSPGYCFLNNYLLISINKELLKSSIDTLSNKAESISSNNAFKVVNQGLTEKNIGVQYLKVDEIAYKMGDILDWSVEMKKERDQKQEAFKSGAQLRMMKVEQQIEMDEKSLSNAENEIIKLLSQVAEKEKNGEDVSVLKADIQDKESKVADIRADIEASISDIRRIEETIASYSQGSGQKMDEELIVDNMITPILNSFKTIEGIGAVTTMSDDAMETKVYIKL